MAPRTWAAWDDRHPKPRSQWLPFVGSPPRLRLHCASRGAFASFGSNSVIQLPVRLRGESHVAVGSDVFIGAGSWIQVLADDNRRRGVEPEIKIGDGTSIAGFCVLSAVCLDSDW